MKLISIREYETFDLPEAEGKVFLALLTTIWQGRKQNPTYAGEGIDDSRQQFFSVENLKDSIRFKANQYMGVYQTQDLRVIVTPKIFEPGQQNAFQILLWIIHYAENIPLPVTPNIEIDPTAKDSMYIELMIWLFANRLNVLLQKKSYMQYSDRRENIGFVKGKILFPEHFKTNIAHNRQDRIFCEYDLYQEDNLFNQIVKYVSETLLRTTKLPLNKRLLEKSLDYLLDVSRKKCTAADTLRIRFNPFQKDFEPILKYCQFFLAQQKPNFSDSSFQLDYVVFDMNRLYEKFIAGFLKTHFSNQWQISSGARHNYLTTDRQFNLEFDFYLKEKAPGKRIIIGDGKYKGVDLSKKGTESGISPADLYQLSTYALREKADQVFLIYPKYPQDTVVETGFLVKDEYANRDIPFHLFKVPFESGNFSELDNALKAVFSKYFSQATTTAAMNPKHLSAR